jgi:hypothetical protein
VHRGRPIAVHPSHYYTVHFAQKPNMHKFNREQEYSELYVTNHSDGSDLQIMIRGALKMADKSKHIS